MLDEHSKLIGQGWYALVIEQITIDDLFANLEEITPDDGDGITNWLGTRGTTGPSVQNATNSENSARSGRNSANTTTLNNLKATLKTERSTAEAAADRLYRNTEQSAWNGYLTSVQSANTVYLGSIKTAENTYKTASDAAEATFDTTTITAYTVFNDEACRLTGLYYDAVNLAQNGSGITSTFFSDGSSSVNFEVCFVAGTPILLADGTSKPIEKIQSGDMVLAVDNEHPNSNPQPCRVVRVFHNAPQSTWKLTLDDGQIIQCTKEHPFYVIGRGWTSAEDLFIGDHLLRPDGSTVSLSAKEYVESKQPVFNFEVENAHTYFVGETHNTAVLVHNVCEGFLSFCEAYIDEFSACYSNTWDNFKIGITRAACETVYYFQDVYGVSDDAYTLWTTGENLNYKERSNLGQEYEKLHPAFNNSEFWLFVGPNAGRAGLNAGTCGASELSVTCYDYAITGDLDTAQQNCFGTSTMNLSAVVIIKFLTPMAGKGNVDVVRWGKTGALEPGDWIMVGKPSRLNYALTFKWQKGYGNQYAPFQQYQTFSVPRSSVHFPSGFGIDGKWKGPLFRQYKYNPSATHAFGSQGLPLVPQLIVPINIQNYSFEQYQECIQYHKLKLPIVPDNPESNND